MQLTRLLRTSRDVSVAGKKGVGKTQILSLVGFLYWILNDAVVFSNYDSLIYPHVYIPSIEMAYKIFQYPKEVPKIFLGDDFERWAFSRMSNNAQNIEFLNDILLDWGKWNCSLYHSAKRQKAIDIGLRESDCEFWELELKPLFVSNTGDPKQDSKNNEIMRQYLNFLYIKINRFDEYLNPMIPIKVKNLENICKLYDTHEVVLKTYKDNKLKLPAVRPNARHGTSKSPETGVSQSVKELILSTT